MLSFAFGLIVIVCSVNAFSPAGALSGRIAETDKRYPTFKMAMDIMVARGLRTIVETGTARDGDRNCSGDGCSTLIWSRFVAGNPEMTVISVDNSPESCKNSAISIEGLGDVKIVESDSVEFLNNWSEKIDLLYLDSFNFDFNNPSPCQEHQLKEIICAFDKLHENSIVLVDDCALPYGGKCALVEKFLLEKGWRTLMKNYQLLMITSNKLVL